LKDKVCLVTGSTSGIGKETVIGLAKEGARLVLPVRNIEKGESLRKEILSMTANSHIELMSCDLASFDSVRSFAKAFLDKYDRLDLLINNAGTWETKRKKSVDGIELTFAVNHLAPFLLTHLLTDRLISSAPSRVINVSSEAHRYGKMRFDDLERNNKWSLFGPYAQSKLANILFTKELARKLNGAGVTVNCLHPGVVSTHLFDAFPKVFASVSSLFMITP
jgi:retinol dehydrogenase 12